MTKNLNKTLSIKTYESKKISARQKRGNKNQGS